MTTPTYAQELRKFEKKYLEKLFKEPHTTVRELIRLSGMANATFYSMLERTGLKLPEYGTASRPHFQKAPLTKGGVQDGGNC